MELCSAVCAAMLFGNPTIESGINDGCLAIPNQVASFGTVTQSSMEKWLPGLQYVKNPQYLSLHNDGTTSSLRQKFEPTSIGSPRVIALMNMNGSRTYKLSQSLYLEEGFDWGGKSESGKIGFGLAGGSAPSGGDLNKDGFTARLMWKGNGDGSAALGVYMYSSDRSQNLPWGDSFLIAGQNIPIGEWFETKLVITMNSKFGSSDGSLSLSLNDEVLIWKNNIQWQAQGHSLVIDKMLYSSFYGGNSSAWAPDHTTYARFSNICVESY